MLLPRFHNSRKTQQQPKASAPLLPSSATATATATATAAKGAEQRAGSRAKLVILSLRLFIVWIGLGVFALVGPCWFLIFTTTTSTTTTTTPAIQQLPLQPMWKLSSPSNRNNNDSSAKLVSSQQRRGSAQSKRNRIKVFSIASNHPNAVRQRQDLATLADVLEHVNLNLDQQRDYLKERVSVCDDAAVARFDDLIHNGQSHLASEVWKYCAVYEHGGVLFDSSTLLLLLSLDTILILVYDDDDYDNNDDVLPTTIKNTKPSIIHNKNRKNNNNNIAILNDAALFPKSLHGSLLYLSQSHSAVAKGMLHVLLHTSIPTLRTRPLLLPRTLYNLVQDELQQQQQIQQQQGNHHNNNHKKTATSSSSSSSTTTMQPSSVRDEPLTLSHHHPHTNSWHFLEQKCSINPLRAIIPNSKHALFSSSSSRRPRTIISHHQKKKNRSRRIHYPCPQENDYCCHVYDRERSAVVAMTRHALLPFQLLPSLHELPKPYRLLSNGTYYHDHHHHHHHHTMDDDVLYISTIRKQVQLVLLPKANSTDDTHLPGARPTITTFYQILQDSDCLPSNDCIKCLKEVDEYDDGQTNAGSCDNCREECSCFCNMLCRVSVPPKPINQEIHVRPPQFARDPIRRVPRIIHQTWFENIHDDDNHNNNNNNATNNNKYPRMRRMMESFRQSGWEHRFYTDQDVVEFLTTHFPSPVLQAYHALRPGAFKADLFRYCVLLIHGGLYADVDILLESNLDAVIGPDVGFLVPVDNVPGGSVNRRMCLWNGFLAAAPGHPFLAKVLEMAVNHVRNRFTVLDYDNMFCPDPQFSILHTYQDLFVTGPCLLGAAVNQVLGRPSQSQFVAGELVFMPPRPATTTTKTNTTTNNHGTTSTIIMEDDDDDDEQHNIETMKLKRSLGKTIILSQSKFDMGAHRFTLLEKNLIVAGTDFPDSKDSITETRWHYSMVRQMDGIYGSTGLYIDDKRANENVRFQIIDADANADTTPFVSL